MATPSRTTLARLKHASRALSSLPLVRWMGRHKRVLVVSLIILFLAFLTYYLAVHPSIFVRLLETNPLVLLLLLVFYLLSISTQVVIMYATIRLCHKKLPLSNGLILTIYSVVANFFGPLQSGPGVRAVYLKQKIGLRIRDYTYTTLFYYFSFAALNTSLLFITIQPLFTVLGIVVSIVCIILASRRFHIGGRLRYVFVIYLITLIQIACTTLIYYTEINAVHAAVHYSYLQSVIYSASANLSLFVSITPGGIGIREGFILFAQSLHHIPLATVIAAGILDRAFYIVLLVGLFLASSAFHLKELVAGKQHI